MVAVGERLVRKLESKPRTPRRRAAARKGGERAAAHRNDAVSRRDQALARRDEKLAARGAPGTRGRGNAVKPVKAPGSSRALRAPANMAHPVTGKPEVAPGPLRKQQRGAEATPTPTPTPEKTPKRKQG